MRTRSTNCAADESSPAASLASDLGRHLNPASADTLMLAVGRGDQVALGTLYDRTGPAVYGRICHILGDTTDAANATVNVYVQLWRSAPRFQSDSGSAHSLIARLTARELVRRRRSIRSCEAAPMPGRRS